jgi:hypothetical protein
MVIQLKRVYAPPESDDGFRVLVDRLWPRGASKSAARIDFWLKEIAPSAALRQWFGHDRRNGARSGLVTSGTSRRTAPRSSSSWRMYVTGR